MISVIIPVLNEEWQIARTLAELSSGAREEDIEVIVADGGSRDRTVEIVRGFETVKLVECQIANRGWQMNAGVEESRGEVLLFLHADCRLPDNAFDSINRAMTGGRVIAGCFQIRFPADVPVSLGLMACGINLRTTLFQTATGDQAIFARRDSFEAIGGYQTIPLMEDVAFFTESKRLGQVTILDNRVEISPRRWLKHGIWRTMFLMYALRIGYWIGISPDTLKRFFVDVR